MSSSQMLSPCHSVASVNGAVELVHVRMRTGIMGPGDVGFNLILMINVVSYTVTLNSCSHIAAILQPSL